MGGAEGYTFFALEGGPVAGRVVIIRTEMSGKATGNTSEGAPAAVWDFTIWDKESTITSASVIIIVLKELCKKWGFQLEMTPIKNGKGGRHWQGRISLRSKTSKGGLLGRFGGKFGTLAIHFTRTSVANRYNFNYVEKADTRIDGPWKWDDPAVEEKPEELTRFPLQPWMESIVDLLKQPNDRLIYVVVDTHGIMCKTFLGKHLTFMKIAKRIPCRENVEDMIKSVASMGESTAYYVNMVKNAGKGRKINLFWQALEQVKDGSVEDLRHKWVAVEMKRRPNILVMTNEVPDGKTYTAGRLKLLAINPTDMSLLPWTEGIQAAIDSYVKNFPEVKTRFEQENPLLEKLDQALIDVDIMAWGRPPKPIPSLIGVKRKTYIDDELKDDDFES